MFPSGIFDSKTYHHEPRRQTNATTAAVAPPAWASRALFKNDPPESVPAGFAVCLLSGLNPSQASKILAKDFEPYWSMIVPILVRVRAVESLPRFDLPQLLKQHSVNGTVQVRNPVHLNSSDIYLIFVQPWFHSHRGSPRSTFSDGPLFEDEEFTSPMLTPLLLDSSSNGYVDSWLQVLCLCGLEMPASRDYHCSTVVRTSSTVRRWNSHALATEKSVV